MSELNSPGKNIIRKLLNPGFQHHDNIFITGHDEVELAVFHLWQRRVQYQFAVNIADVNGAYRPVKGYLGYRECRRGANQRQCVRVVLLVRRKHGGDDLWMLSTGTGIGPFISMLRTEQPWRRFKRIVIVQGVREAQDLTYREFINECQQRYPGQLVYQPIVSREALPEALAGRIPDLIASNELQEACGVHFNERSQVMLCGNPDMIQASREQLKALGLEKNTRRKPGQVTSENYW